MVVVGADVHKRTHTFVGVDEAARESATRRSPRPPTGIGPRCGGPGRGWARGAVAVKDCRHLLPPGSSATCSPTASRWSGCRRR